MEDKALKYYVGDDYGTFDNPCRQSHFSTMGLCGYQFYLKYILGFDSELRRINTEIGIYLHDAMESFHSFRYLAGGETMDKVVNRIVKHRDNPTEQTKEDVDKAKEELGIDLWFRLVDPDKPPIKQVETNREKTRGKTEDDTFEMLQTYCQNNEENDILVINYVPMCEVDTKFQINETWYEGTIDQIRVHQETKEKYGNRFSFEKFCDLRDADEMKIELVDTKTGIMVPGFYGLTNSIQLRLYATGIRDGTFLINNKPICLGLLPERAYIYHTRKLQTYKVNYTHPTTKQKFKKGDMKGDPVLTIYKTKQDLEDSLVNFPDFLERILDCFKKEVYAPNTLACDTFCDIPEGCIHYTGKHIDDDILEAAKLVEKQLNLGGEND